MKIKLLSSALLLLMLSTACKKEEIDIAQLTFNKPLEIDLNHYASRVENQNGHIEVSDGGFKTVDKGEKVIKYSFDEKETANLKFHGSTINPSIGAVITTYNNLLSFVSFTVNAEQTDVSIQYLKKKFGKAYSASVNNIIADALSAKTKAMLKESFPEYYKEYKNDFNSMVVDYPQVTSWVKNDVLYRLTLDPVNNSLNFKLDIITKKAFEDAVILGYHKNIDNPFK
ncbi:hypothetical protein [Pedobacter sp. Leaf216]|uniref:hypothetical protein n=1 Tax=Pedobacter sp. Leaf216 TaxID=1735684 RepID=UPI000A49C6D5|nr:hypothetical protein [Pedobacter sp. Leaf216]